jgi:4-hydroxy-tetrahydrodipicolinate reductase
LLAHKLSWQTSEILETGNAIVAKNDIRTQHLEVRRGQTCGLHQHVEARSEGELRITLDLKMYLDAENPHDRIQIEGEPPIDMLIRGGIAGDQATVAALVNTAPRLLRSEPGLRLVTDLPLG